MNLTLLSQLRHQRKRKNKAAKGGKTYNLEIWISSCYVTFTLPLSYIQPSAGKKKWKRSKLFLKSERGPELLSNRSKLFSSCCSGLSLQLQLFLRLVETRVYHIPLPCVCVHVCVFALIENECVGSTSPPLCHHSTLNPGCVNHSSMMFVRSRLTSSYCWENQNFRSMCLCTEFEFLEFHNKELQTKYIMKLQTQ